MHDLRRTTATGMADTSVAHHVLNHTAGKMSGVAAIYNRSQYLPERKAALEAWSRHLETLVYPRRAQTNVVAMCRGDGQ
jgi:hypothetical protein